jgi:hypothetical protein
MEAAGFLKHLHPTKPYSITIKMTFILPTLWFKGTLEIILISSHFMETLFYMLWVLKCYSVKKCPELYKIIKIIIVFRRTSNLKQRWGRTACFLFLCEILTTSKKIYMNKTDIHKNKLPDVFFSIHICI